MMFRTNLLKRLLLQTTKPGQHRGGNKHLEELVEIGTTIDISEQGVLHEEEALEKVIEFLGVEDYVQLPEAPQEGSVHLSNKLETIIPPSQLDA